MRNLVGSMRKKVLFGVILALVVFMVIPAAAAFAGPADFGLGVNALPNVIANTPGKGANPPLDTTVPAGAPGFGTHTAVGRIVCLNPAQDLADCP